MVEIVDVTDGFGGSGGTPETKYWIYVVINEYYEGLLLQDSFVQLMINFGTSLGDKAKVVIPLKGHYCRTRRSVLKAAWEENTWEQLDKATDIYMLAIPCPLSSFRPKDHNFILMWLPNALETPTQYIHVLKDIANEITRGRDIFEWHLRKTSKYNKFLRKLYSSVSAKPGIFGFSIDLKELLKKMS